MFFVHLEEMMNWLRAFVVDKDIDSVIMVYSPYIYNVVPQVTRIRGQKGYNFPFYGDEKERLLRAATKFNFSWIDFVDIANKEAKMVGSQFAPLALYVDRAHYSPLGVERIVDRVLEIRIARH